MPSHPESSETPEGAREQILAAARDEFAGRGFDAASVRAIARTAGVTAAMINYYFGGKRALYETIVAEAQARLRACLMAALAGERAGAIARLAAAYFDFLADERQTQRLLLREVLDGEEGGEEHGSERVAPLRALLSQHFGDDEEALQNALSLFGAVAGYFIYEPIVGSFLGVDPHSPQALARRRQHIINLATKMEEWNP